MTQFPDGLGVGGGRFRLASLLRGTPSDGLWTARDHERARDVWVTLRHARHTRARAEKLQFETFGISAPLYIGPPDLYTPNGESVRDAHVCVVDDIPDGVELARVGRLSLGAGIQLGIDLCEVVATWAAVADGYILRGLRPETIFVSAEGHRFTGATPRPYFLLGNQNEFDAYPSMSFDPPTPGPYEIERRDAVFTVALLLWWVVTGVHPYVIPGTSTDRNEYEDNRLPFDGAAPLGHVLERALVADPARRTDLDELRSSLARLLR